MAGRKAESLLEIPEIKPPRKEPILSRIAEDAPEKMTLAAALLEAHTLKTAEVRLRAVKARIQELMLNDERDQVRVGPMCAIARLNKGRKTFSAELAIEAGITPQQIDASMKQGADYWVLELPEIKYEEETE